MPASIRIFRVEPMEFTFFCDGEIPETLAKAGVIFVGDPDEADIILARSPSTLRGYRFRPAHLAVWTHEPRYCTFDQSVATRHV